MNRNKRSRALPPEADPLIHQRGVCSYFDISKTALHYLKVSGELAPDGYLNGRPVWRFSTLRKYEAARVTTTPTPRASAKNLKHAAGGAP